MDEDHVCISPIPSSIMVIGGYLMHKTTLLVAAILFMARLAFAAEAPPELKNWKITEFDGRGEVKTDSGVIILGKGNDMTGVTWTGPYPKMNFEISLDAKRMEGEDFFCGLTFPVNEKPCSLIVGGWGGTCVGISSIDFNDAYNNETARFITFDLNKWYHIRMRVTPGKLEAWIDDKQVVNCEIKDREIGIRSEVELSRPVGVATWRTTGGFRNFKIEEVKEK
jgi:hypothetical protein